MSDIPATPAIPVGPIAAPAQPVAAPEPAAVAPAAESPVAPVATEVSAVPPEAPAADGAPPATEFVDHTAEPGLLAATEPAKPAAEAAKPDAEAKPAEAGAPTDAQAPAAEPIVYEPFTLPEGVKLEGDGMAKFTEWAGANRLPQDQAQQLVDMHVAEVQRLHSQSLADQHRAFADTRREWRNQIMADEQLGGAGFETNRAAAQRMLNMFVPEAHRGAFNQAMLLTGAADHPEIFRAFVNAARFFDEPAPAPAPHGPPPNMGRNPSAGRRLQYSNPTSPRVNGAR